MTMMTDAATRSTPLPTSVNLPDAGSQKLLQDLRQMHTLPDLLERLHPDSRTRWVYLYAVFPDRHVYLYHVTTSGDVQDCLSRHCRGDFTPTGTPGEYLHAGRTYRAVLGLPDVPGSRAPGFGGLPAF